MAAIFGKTNNDNMTDLFLPEVNHFHDGGRYHIETSPLICGANQWTGFYIITATFMKGLNTLSFSLMSQQNYFGCRWDPRSDTNK